MSIAFLLAAAVAVPVAAPVPAAVVDRHIRYIDYDADSVVRLVGYTGYQMILEFGPDERIETVGIGDGSGWQVTPNGAASVMYLKPVGVARTTNLSIVTNVRRYNIELSARSGLRAMPTNIIYAVRFRYAKPAPTVAEGTPPPPLIATPEAAWNRAYTYDGARENLPDLVFDDGKSTYLRFGPGKPVPAIFAITDKSGETIVNTAQRGPYTVIDQLAPRFVLRQGPVVTIVYNEGFRAPDPGADAPKPRARTKHGLFGATNRKVQ